MPVKIHGLPAHVLLIHIVVIFVPLAALMLVASAVWPAARRRLGFLTPLVALIALAAVPVTTHAGEWLRDRIDPKHQNAQISHHAALGDDLLPWAIALFVLAAVVWLLGRRFELQVWPRRDTDSRPPRPSPGPGPGATATRVERHAVTRVLPVWVAPLLALASLAAAVGAIWMLVRIGDSGAQAAWGYVNQLPAQGG